MSHSLLPASQPWAAPVSPQPWAAPAAPGDWGIADSRARPPGAQSQRVSVGICIVSSSCCRLEDQTLRNKCICLFFEEEPSLARPPGRAPSTVIWHLLCASPCLRTLRRSSNLTPLSGRHQPIVPLYTENHGALERLRKPTVTWPVCSGARKDVSGVELKH